jgi:hypothetical protein
MTFEEAARILQGASGQTRCIGPAQLNTLMKPLITTEVRAIDLPDFITPPVLLKLRLMGYALVMFGPWTAMQIVRKFNNTQSDGDARIIRSKHWHEEELTLLDQDPARECVALFSMKPQAGFNQIQYDQSRELFEEVKKLYQVLKLPMPMNMGFELDEKQPEIDALIKEYYELSHLGFNARGTAQQETLKDAAQKKFEEAFVLWNSLEINRFRPNLAEFVQFNVLFEQLNQSRLYENSAGMLRTVRPEKKRSWHWACCLRFSPLGFTHNIGAPGHSFAAQGCPIMFPLT